MNKIFIFLSIGILLVGSLIFINEFKNNKFEDTSNGILFLKSTEKEHIRNLRDNGFEGIIYIPEEDLLYGKTENLEIQKEEVYYLTNNMNKF